MTYRNYTHASWIKLLSLLHEPSDKRVYLIHILINTEPHFLLPGALEDDIIHQELSRVEKGSCSPGPSALGGARLRASYLSPPAGGRNTPRQRSPRSLAKYDNFHK